MYYQKIIFETLFAIYLKKNYFLFLIFFNKSLLEKEGWK